MVLTDAYSTAKLADCTALDPVKVGVSSTSPYFEVSEYADCMSGSTWDLGR